MKPLGDRRARVRLEVLGSLMGTLELAEPARIVDISAHGALIESPAQYALGSLQELRMTFRGQLVRVTARVRRLQPVSQPGESRQTPRYMIGLEFLSPPSALTESIAQLVGDR